MSGGSAAPILRHLPFAAGGLLALALVWAPLPYASVLPPAEALLRLAAALALALAAPAVAVRPGRLAPVAVPAAALAAVAAWGFVQALPLPAAVVRLLSPRHAELWAKASELTGGVGWPRLTVEAAASRGVALSAAALAAALVAAALAGRSRRVRRALWAAVLVAALVQIVYGARGWLAESSEIWGRTVPGVADRLRGSFVNPNHLAYLLEIALAVAFAATWWALARARREPSLERRLLLATPPIVVWLALLTGLVLTGSRAGLLAAVVAVTVQGALVAWPRRRWRLAPIGLLVALVGLGIVAGVASLSSFGRLTGTSLGEVASGARAEVAGRTLGLWGRFPITGSGLGTFADAYATVEPTGQAAGLWLHAHNDYLEWLATGGPLAALLLAAALLALLRRLSAVLARGRRSEDRAAALAALGALAAVAVHEAFDFGLTMPAVAFTLAVVVGAGAGARTGERTLRR